MKKALTLLIASEILILGILVSFKHEIIATGLLEASVNELKASWYGVESCVREDCLMSNGKRFDETKISCASRTHYGKVLTIEYQGKTIQCPVTDKIAVRYDSSRIDISKAGFAQLSPLSKGIISINMVEL